MKIKYLLFVLAVFTVFLGVSLLLSEDIPLKVITSPKVYSMKHTELNETFKISVLMNKNNTYHLDTTYIKKSSIKDGESQFPITVKRIEVSQETMEVFEEEYYLVNFVVILKLEANDHLIIYDKARLEVTYENEQVLDLYIGELNYMFKENEGDLSLYNLQGTFGEVNGINTVTGVAIELYNQSTNNITIKRIDVFSSDVSFNNDFFIEKDRTIDMFEEVQDILVQSTYDFETYESTEHYHSILERQTKKFYIPLLFNSDIQYIRRFVTIVTYEIDGVEQEYYIDDFIFMNAMNFGPEFEKNYEVYTYEDN